MGWQRGWGVGIVAAVWLGSSGEGVRYMEGGKNGDSVEWEL